MHQGTRLGTFEIIAPLGEGGMGQVWRATDSTLGRDVALKMLPPDFASDPDRHARFEREAKVLASLNHPNIATLFGLEHADGQHVLVMELVPGEDLSEIIARGPLPQGEAISIALQIAEALEAAHEQGIVHRDLKPANIKISDDGTVKVLDFGLAKAWETEDTDHSLSLSPTLTRHDTAAGVILGTAAYMSPDQARGKKVDRRADIWAFGVVLWEMLTGRKLFDGDTVSDVLASVLKETPDLEALPPETPPHVRRIIARCLERDPKHRLQWVGDARIELENPDEIAEPVDEPNRLTTRRKPVLWFAAGAMASAVVGAMLWNGLGSTEPAPQRIRTSILPPAGTSFNLPSTYPGPVSVSPDGTTLVFTARDGDGVELLWVRPLADGQARPLLGTDGAAYPFWSPDGRKVGFFAGGKLKKIAAEGGPAVTLADAQYGKGGTWNSADVILFAPDHRASIHSVPAGGGEAAPVTLLEQDKGANSHRFPVFLPDGKHFLFLSRRGSRESDDLTENDSIMVASLDGKVSKELVKAPSNAAFASGHLLYGLEGMLMAQAFDPSRLQLEGDAFPVAENILIIGGARASVFSVSTNGVLVYLTGESTEDTQLLWMDGDGRVVESLGEPAQIYNVSPSFDWKTATATLTDPATRTEDIWIYDLERGIRSRFTTNRASDRSAVISPDGTKIVFASNREGTFDLYEASLVEGGQERLLYGNSDIELYPTNWSPDGRSLVVYGQNADGSAIFRLDLDDADSLVTVVDSDFSDHLPDLSPDGRWLVHTSGTSGRPEIYVTSYVEPGRPWQVSADGGDSARWSADGRRVYWVDYDGVLNWAEVDGSSTALHVGEITKGFAIPLAQNAGIDYAVAPGGERFLINGYAKPPKLDPMTLVLNWTADLDRP